MRALLVGYSEIGRAVQEVFGPFHRITVCDPPQGMEEPEGSFDVLLVAIPYSDNFVEIVNGYRERHDAQGTIIFSTVAIGTTRQIPSAVHSPVEGKHPHLAESMRLMPRWVGGRSEVAEQFLLEAGIVPKRIAQPEFTEFVKLRSTARYGVNIEFARYEKSVCDDLGMSYEHIREFDEDYNTLYLDLDMPEYQRYILHPPTGNIGGHCLRSNARILDSQYPSWFLKEIYRDKEGA